MNIKKHSKIGKKAALIGILSVIFLFISSATAVPQVNGSISVDNIEKYNRNEAIISLLTEQIDLFDLESNNVKLDTVYVIACAVEQLLLIVSNPDCKIDADSILKTCEISETDKISENDVLLKTSDCIEILSVVIQDQITKPDISTDEKDYYESLQTHIVTMGSLVEQESLINAPADEYQPQELIQKLLTLLLIILIIPLLILSGVFIAAVGIISGILFCIGVIVKILIIVFIGIQSALTFSAFIILFIGIISKVIIRIFSLIASPIIGVIASRLTTLIGKILGNLALVISSLIAVLLIFAIPIVAVVAVLVIQKLLEPDEGDETTLVGLVMTSVFRTFLNAGVSEDTLHLIWVWLGNNIPAVPDWPFDG